MKLIMRRRVRLPLPIEAVAIIRFRQNNKVKRGGKMQTAQRRMMNGCIAMTRRRKRNCSAKPKTKSMKR